MWCVLDTLEHATERLCLEARWQQGPGLLCLAQWVLNKYMSEGRSLSFGFSPAFIPQTLMKHLWWAQTWARPLKCRDEYNSIFTLKELSLVGTQRSQCLQIHWDQGELLEPGAGHGGGHLTEKASKSGRRWSGEMKRQGWWGRAGASEGWRLGSYMPLWLLSGEQTGRRQQRGRGPIQRCCYDPVRGSDGLRNWQEREILEY